MIRNRSDVDRPEAPYPRVGIFAVLGFRKAAADLVVAPAEAHRPVAEVREHWWKLIVGIEGRWTELGSSAYPEEGSTERVV